MDLSMPVVNMAANVQDMDSMPPYLSSDDLRDLANQGSSTQSSEVPEMPSQSAASQDRIDMGLPAVEEPELPEMPSQSAASQDRIALGLPAASQSSAQNSDQRILDGANPWLSILGATSEAPRIALQHIVEEAPNVIAREVPGEEAMDSDAPINPPIKRKKLILRLHPVEEAMEVDAPIPPAVQRRVAYTTSLHDVLGDGDCYYRFIFSCRLFV